ncbi:hypothetical protein ACROYT_G031358 [Oculina patagonica]
MEEAKPVLAGGGKYKKLKARVEKLEKSIEKITECSPCQKIKEINEKLDDVQEEIDALKETKPGAFGGESTILGNLDKKYTDQLMTFLEPVLQKPSSTWMRCWHAITDGWNAATFHEKCDEKGPTITIIKAGDYIFGGYTNEPWRSKPCAYATANKAFIFTLYNKNGYKPLKQPLLPGNEDAAMYNCNDYGPTFGNGNDIYIADQAASKKESYTSCGHTYQAPSGYSVAEQVAAGRHCDYIAGSFQFTPNDVEVFYEVVN